MKLGTKCLISGTAPYGDVKYLTAMMAKLFGNCPSLMFLPNISDKENLICRTFTNIPEIVFDEGNIRRLKHSSSKSQKAFAQLENAYLDPSYENMQKFGFESIFLEKFLQMVKKFKSKNAIVPILGPFSSAEILSSDDEIHMLADKDFRRLLVYAICVKTLWIISEINKFSPETKPVILFNEPLLYRLGNLKRENESITAETVISLYSKIFDKIKAAGALTCIQSFEKCDWTVPIKAGADIISFDAYNNPNNLTIIPEVIEEYLEQGGLINWAIVPSHSENIIRNTGADALWSRLTSTFESLIMSGVSRNLVYKSATVSVSGNADKLPVIFAEKAYILANQLGSKLTANFNN